MALKPGKKRPLMQADPGTGKKSQIGRRKNSFQAEYPKNIQREEKGISDRRFSPTFISPATTGFHHP